METYIVVYCTVPDEKTGKKIAEALLQERLAACVSLTAPLQSFYWWEGRIAADPEFLLIIKTRENLFFQLEDRIASLHPYDVPEIIALPINRGHSPYLAWIGSETRAQEKS